MDPESLLSALRSQPFYKGQILRVRHTVGQPPQSCSLDDFFERVPRLASGSLRTLFAALGLEDVYATLLAGFRRAFPEGSNEPNDVVLIESRSGTRDLFWQLACMVGALDEGQLGLVLCPNTTRLKAAATRIQQTINRADIEYALPIAAVNELSDFSCFKSNVPLLLVMRPETLRDLLRGRFDPAIKETVLSALGRVVLPDVEEWPPALASHTAYLLRELHIECGQIGVFPSLLATSAPVLDVEEYVSEFWGKTVDGGCFIRPKAVETPPICYINYSGGLIRDPRNPARLIRQGTHQVATELLKYLVGDYGRAGFENVELHYVLDISGSMQGRLPQVIEAVIQDLRMKLAAKSIKAGDWVKLSVFEMSVRNVFGEHLEEGTDTASAKLVENFSAAIRAQTAGGGTNIPVALGAALKTALTTDAGAIEIILFSDGESPVAPSHRAHVLRLTRELRSQGKALGLLYVVLDMAPPTDIVNLIENMGGEVRPASSASLVAGEGFNTDVTGEDPKREVIVVLAGERGLPSGITQEAQGGKRDPKYTRDISKLDVDSREVGAVVVTGRFASLDQIRNQVSHLGRYGLPVFILTEAEAWGQMLTEDYEESAQLAMAPLLWPRNEFVRRLRLSEFLRDRRLPAEVVHYFIEGRSGHDRFRRFVGDKTVGEAAIPPGDATMVVLPSGFEVLGHGDRQFVEVVASDKEPPKQDRPLHTWTDDLVRLEGVGITADRDRANAHLVLHPGAVADHGDFSGEVETEKDGVFKLKARSVDLSVPLINQIQIEQAQTDDWTRKKDHLGEVSVGPVKLTVQVAGRRIYPGGNLDNRFEPERFGDRPNEVAFNTCALRLRPAGATDTLLSGLSNVLRLALVAVFRYADQTLLVYPDNQDSIWLIDLAVGGNGASNLLYRCRHVLGNLLSLGGRVLLECPCEGGFSGASTQEQKGISDTGCPRCMRVAGPVILENPNSEEDRFGKANKEETLNWLLKHGYLPGSAEKHMEDKYQGVTDSARVDGPDNVSRRGFIKLTRRILSDRLGLDIDDNDVAAFEWLAPNDKLAGQYDAKRNVLAILQGLREWYALDVCAHELFHNYQCRVPELFNFDAIGPEMNPKPPFDGKLFLEGSTMWAESHVVDALAIRTSLDQNNLRQGDEYGEGFQLFKYIEENHGGVPAVLEFLRTGDIAAVTNGEISDLSALYGAAGIKHKLK